MIEMIVSVAIMIAISTVIAMNQSKYTSGAELRNLANNLSLSLRQAQVYGISVKELSAYSSNFNVGYGVEFRLTAPGDNKSYVFFADRGTLKNGLYDDGWYCPIGGDSECLDKITLGQNNYIEALCVIEGNNESCGVDRIDITFIRPATEALIIVNGDAEASEDISGVKIKLSSTDDTKKNSVSVYVTGQISVQ